MKSALEMVKWPGRQQKHVLSDKLAIYLDGSHTFESISATAQWFSQSSTNNVENVLFFHATPDRDHTKLLQPLKDISHLFSKVYFMIPSSIHGNMEKIKEYHAEMSEFWSKMTGSQNVFLISDIPDDLHGPFNVLVCGSLYLVGHFMKAFSIEA